MGAVKDIITGIELAYEEVRRLEREEREALSEYEDEYGDVPVERLRYYDEARTDYAYALAEAGSALADAVKLLLNRVEE